MSSRSILTLMSKVLDNQFAGETWDGWRVLLKAMFALDLTRRPGQRRQARPAPDE